MSNRRKKKTEVPTKPPMDEDGQLLFEFAVGQDYREDMKVELMEDLDVTCYDPTDQIDVPACPF